MYIQQHSHKPLVPIACVDYSLPSHFCNLLPIRTLSSNHFLTDGFLGLMSRNEAYIKSARYPPFCFTRTDLYHQTLPLPFMPSLMMCWFDQLRKPIKTVLPHVDSPAKDTGFSMHVQPTEPHASKGPAGSIRHVRAVAKKHPKAPPPPPNYDRVCVLSMDTWWIFGHELKQKKQPPPPSESTTRRNSAKLPKNQVLGAALMEECHAKWNDTCTATTALFCAILHNFDPALQVG